MHINLDSTLLKDNSEYDLVDDSPVKYPSIYASRHSSRMTVQSFDMVESVSLVARNRSLRDSAFNNAPNLLREYLNDRLETAIEKKNIDRRTCIARTLGTFIPVALCLVLVCLEKRIDHHNANVGRCMGIIVLLSGWWIAGPIPSIAVSLTPVVLFPFAGILSGAEVAKSYFSYVQMLLVGAFLVDLCIEESRLAERFGLKGLIFIAGSKEKVRPSRMVFGFMAMSYCLSLFIANTSVTMMLMPFCISLLDKIEAANKDQKENCHRFCVATLLGVAYAANCGGLATSIGTTANLILINDMTELYGLNHSPSVAKFFLLCSVPSLGMFCAAFVVILLRWCRNLRKLNVPAALAKEELVKLGRMDWDQYIVLFAQLSQMALWFARSIYSNYGLGDLDDGTVSILCALPLFFIPSSQRPGEMILTKKMVAHIDWEILMLIGAGFAIAAAVNASKLDNFVATAIGTGNSDTPLYLVVFIAFSAVTFLTEFASSMATANVLLPILALTALHSQVHPLALMLPAALGCSCAFSFPIATPSNAVVYSMGRFSLKEMVHTGFFVSLAAIFIVPFLLLFYTFPVGHIGTYEHSHRPEWADKTPSPTPEFN